MKKLIAMLLALALVASFGVTSVFAASPSNADSSKLFGYRADTEDANQGYLGAQKDLAGQVRDLWQEWDLEHRYLVETGASAAEIAALDNSYAAEMNILKNESKINGLGLDAFDLYKWDETTETWVLDKTIDMFDMSKTFADGWLDAKDVVSALGQDIGRSEEAEANFTYWENYYKAKAAKDSAKAADNAAKTAAWNTYLASDRTALDKAIYNVAAANIDAQRALTNAKAAMADAKADWGTALNTYKSTVNVKVAEAQADYYVAVADAYQEAVAGAISEIYALLG